MKKRLPQTKENATKDAKDIEKAGKKQKKYLPQVDADKRRCSQTENVFIVFIYVYLWIKMIVIFCKFRLKGLVILAAS